MDNTTEVIDALTNLAATNPKIAATIIIGSLILVAFTYYIDAKYERDVSYVSDSTRREYLSRPSNIATTA